MAGYAGEKFGGLVKLTCINKRKSGKEWAKEKFLFGRFFGKSSKI